MCFPQIGISSEQYKPALNIDNEIAYESEYVHRGRKLGQMICATSTAAAYHFKDSSLLQVGLKSRTELESSQTSGYVLQQVLGEQFEASFNTIVPYVRYERQLSDVFTATLGYLHYYYPKMNKLNDSFYRASGNRLRVGIKQHANEIMFGLWANVIFRPTVFVFYNFDFDEFVAVGHQFAK
ncbi:MAG: hypothetical protein K2L13_00950, partial [Opitutales bacterium]|nr:hypothetical protein [Opitutales bacterium]